MQYLVTAVSMNKVTCQNSRTRAELIDTEKNELFKLCRRPAEIMEIYENFWDREEFEDIVKVIDILRL